MAENSFISSREQTVLGAIFLIGLGAAYLLGDHFWQSYLVNSLFVLTIALGAAIFVTVHHISNAGWTSVLRRVPEAMMSYLPLGAVSLLMIFFGRHQIYEWTNTRYADHGASFAFKDAWLETPFFFFRMVLFLAIWIWLLYVIRKASFQQDADGVIAHSDKAKRYSAIFLVVFGITYSLAAFDWIMSVEPLFYSTIFAFYVIAGTLLAGVAAITLFVIVLQSRGLLTEVGDKQMHKLGVTVLGFATFWAYIWISQYLLIYYANLPEETIYFVRRTSGRGWFAFFIVNLLLNWVIPFVMLLQRKVKSKRNWMVAACVIVLIGHWIDFYVMILPAFSETPSIGIADITLLAAFTALFVAAFARSLTSGNLIPVKDPYLAESIWHERLKADDRSLIADKT